jgi:hypothetical protein
VLAELHEAHEQSRGELGPGDPFGLLIMLIAPLLASGLWARTSVAIPVAPPNAEVVVAAFLDGHRK